MTPTWLLPLHDAKRLLSNVIGMAAYRKLEALAKAAGRVIRPREKQ